jgi:hypothetical protein
MAKGPPTRRLQVPGRFTRLVGTAIGLAIVVGACGIVDGGDQWFTLSILNDTTAPVVLEEPSLNCTAACFSPLATIDPHSSYGLSVLANGGAKTYELTATSGAVVGCLPTAYDTPPANPTVALSRILVLCRQ